MFPRCACYNVDRTDGNAPFRRLRSSADCSCPNFAKKNERSLVRKPFLGWASLSPALALSLFHVVFSVKTVCCRCCCCCCCFAAALMPLMLLLCLSAAAPERRQAVELFAFGFRTVRCASHKGTFREKNWRRHTLSYFALRAHPYVLACTLR